MKSLCALLMTVFCLSTGLATPLEIKDTAPCRDYFKELNATLSPVEQVRQDLIQGTWASKEAEVADWSFQDDGTLFVVRQSGKEYRVEKAAWTVQYHHTAAILYLSDMDHQKELRYLVEQNCDGINLENVDSDELLLLQYQKGSERRYRSVMQTIQGHWEHNLASEVIASLPSFSTSNGPPVKAKILVDLKADGTFAQTLISAAQDIRKTTFGKWVLSPSGKFLIVYALDGSRKIRCLPIQYLEYDELVLSQLLPADYTSTADQGFYFNKS